ncbi:MAG: outer membrane beta-barrel protein [Legionellaceae bacterium]|nr:outer membrane beta-barrel protein [Legionellaceae bacterium]
MDLFNISLARIGRVFLLFSLFYSQVLLADVTSENTVSTNAPIIVNHSPWDVDFGMRYWLGSGKYKMTLMGDNNELVSRLTYGGFTSNAAEGFWSLNNTNGVFLKGYFGGGSNANGQLIDKDFPPGIIYSRTASNQENGTLNYFSMDLGYNLLAKDKWQMGAFAGYHYWLEHYNSFGCTQTVNGTVCATPIPTSVDVLNDNLTWNALRLGLNGTADITDDLNVVVDAAYTHSYLSANDFHNLRPSIRGIFEDGIGNGVQLDTTLNWEVSERLKLGVGGRWWHVSTNGFAHFDQTSGGGDPQPINLKQDVYGLLLQTNYTFGDDPVSPPLLWKDSPAPLTPFNWQGIYLGANVGYGMYPNNVSIYPNSATAIGLAESTPTLLNVQSSGFLGGGQLGYNWQINRLILGIESDLDYAHVSGANSVLQANPQPLVTTISKNIGWLATIRGRIGKLASDSMLAYVTAGPAFGRTQLAFDQRVVEVSCASGACATGNQHQTNTGWTVGGGIEYAVTKRATYKAEYLYANLGNNTLNTNLNSLGSNYIAKSSFNSNIIRLGVNYKVA